MDRILLVEDSAEVQTLVKAALDNQYELAVAGSLGSAQEILSADPDSFSLFLLDVVLPDGSGFDLCERIRQTAGMREIPVIFLTGKSETADKLTAFSLGADDYIVKPFDRDELSARIKVRLERSGASAKKAFRIAGLKFDVALQRVFAIETQAERDVELTPVEFKILYFLASHPGSTFSREQLIQAIWRKDVHVIEENIYTHISMLRKKLGDKSACIESVPRHGYRFAAVAAPQHG